MYDKILLGNGSSPFYKFMYVMTLEDFEDIGKIIISHSEYVKNPLEHISGVLIEYVRFVINKVKYVCFYVDIDMRIMNEYSIYRFVHKTKDIYNLGGKYFSGINSLAFMQGLERNKIGKNAVATAYLDELVANKVEYVYYLKEKGLMNSKLRHYMDIDRYRNDAKIPYVNKYTNSSYDYDSEKHYDMSDEIVVDKTDGLYLKCFCVSGDIDLILDHKKCIYSKFTKTSKGLGEKKLRKIQKICKRVFLGMNKLIWYRMVKLRYETDMAKFMVGDIGHKEKKLTEQLKQTFIHVLTSLVNSRKRYIIDYMNHTFGKSIDYDTFTMPVMNYVEKKDEYDIYDNFMRIDIDISDKGDITVVNIESYTTDKTKYKYVKDFVPKNKGIEHMKQFLLKRIVETSKSRFIDFDNYIEPLTI